MIGPVQMAKLGDAFAFSTTKYVVRSIQGRVARGTPVAKAPGAKELLQVRCFTLRRLQTGRISAPPFAMVALPFQIKADMSHTS